MLGIKTMKVPKCCRECNFKYYDEGEDVLCCALEDGYISDDEADEKRLECCPLVETEERWIGKWIYDKTIQNWRCSECDETPKTIGYVGTADFMAEHFRFCNHCGAKMDNATNGDIIKAL